MDCTSQHSYAYGIDAIPETFLTCSIGNKRNIGDKGSYLYGFWWYLLCYQSTVAVTRKAKYTLSQALKMVSVKIKQFHGMTCELAIKPCLALWNRCTGSLSAFQQLIAQGFVAYAGPDNIKVKFEFNESFSAHPLELDQNKFYQVNILSYVFFILDFNLQIQTRLGLTTILSWV